MSKSNRLLRAQIVAMERRGRKAKVGLWRDGAEYLASGKAERTEVNVGRLSRIGEPEEVFFVPGKVLGSGTVDKAMVVGAFSFSSSARRKIEVAGGKALAVEELLKKYPDGSGVRLVR